MMSANLRAFLAMIRWCEGTSGENGYKTIVGGSLFDDFSDHPNVVKTGTFGNGKAWRSTAAGAYQFLHSTWLECKQALDLPDFSPESQDAAAVFLIKRRGALHAVEEGNLDQAIWICCKEWASLPGSPYGQPTKSLDACKVIFERAGGTLMQAATARSDPSPPATVSLPAPKKETTVSPLVIPAISALVEALPSLLRIFKGDSKTVERNAKAVEVISAVVKDVTGETTVSGAAEKVLTDPAAKAAFEQAINARYYELVEVGGGIAEARGWAEKMTAGTDWRAIGFGAVMATLSLLVIVGGGWIFYAVLFHDGTTAEQKGMLVGALVAFLSSVISYWFGSSVGSKQSGDAVRKIAEGK